MGGIEQKAFYYADFCLFHFTGLKYCTKIQSSLEKADL